MQFKPGDRIKRIRKVCTHNGMEIGDEDEVMGVFPHGVLLKKFGHGHTPTNLALVSPSMRQRILEVIAPFSQKSEDILNEISSGYEIVFCRWADGSGSVEVHKSSVVFPQIGSIGLAEERFNFLNGGALQAFKNALLFIAGRNGKLGPQAGETVNAKIEGQTYKVKILERI